MEDRMTVYQPNKGFKKANFLWGLICCALAYRGKSVKVVVLPVVRVWEEPQLPLAEILVTMLGSSLVTRGGVNGYAPGTNKYSGTGAALQEGQRCVFSFESHLAKNAEATLKELEKKEKGVEGLRACLNFPSVSDQNSMIELEKKGSEISHLERQYEDLPDELKNRLRGMKRQARELEKHVEWLGDAISSLEIIFGETS